MSLITKINSDKADAETKKANPVKPLNPVFPFVVIAFKPAVFGVMTDPPKRTGKP